MSTLLHLSSYAFRSRQLGLFRQLGEFKGRQTLGIRQQPQVLDTLRQVALLESVQYSNRLEGVLAGAGTGSSYPQEQVRRLVHREQLPVTKRERQIAGYRDALDLVLEEDLRPLGEAERLQKAAHLSEKVRGGERR